MKSSEMLLTVPSDKNYGVVDREKEQFYGELYDESLSTISRDSQTSLLEIGVQSGGSLKVWSGYFRKAQILGIDIVDVRETESH